MHQLTFNKNVDFGRGAMMAVAPPANPDVKVVSLLARYEPLKSG